MRDSLKLDYLRNTAPTRIEGSAALVARREGSVADERRLDRQRLLELIVFLTLP
jgi:hypothetical protein